MRRLLIALLLLLVLCMCTACVFRAEPTPPVDEDPGAESDSQPDQVLTTGDGDVGIWLETREQSWGREERRTYTLPNGDRFCQVRCSFDPQAQPGEVILDRLELPLETTMHHYSQENQEWFVSQLGGGQIVGGQYHANYATGSLMLVAPLCYAQRENQMLEYLPAADGYLRSQELPQGWELQICVQVQPGAQAECFYLLSDEELIDWQGETALKLWANYDFSGANRWCYQGYYYQTPENYIPSGENYFHRLPAAYIAAQCGEKEGRIYYDLALPMLHVMLQLQNDQGFFPTYAGSQWLQGDYLVGPGFYDTRFNSDLVEALLIMNERYQIPEFADAAMRYGQYYQSMAEINHYSLPMENEEEAWLIWDYAYKDCLSNHSSLNHQIAEILVLYHLFDLTGYAGYETLADTLLNGILEVGENWILPDGDLAYAYLADGSMGLQDYPYLTYNDLFDLCQALDARYGSHDPLLDTLMTAKRGWMDGKGITEYKK